MNLRATFTLALTLAAVPVLAQTAAQELQRGIFAQESQGNLDSAITIYRQLANSTLTPREIAAQAQTRLVQTLLRKGDVSTATREMERLERDFPDYSKLVTNAPTPGAQTHGPQSKSGEPDLFRLAIQDLMPSMNFANFDGGRTGAIRGTVEMVFWTNPTSYMVVDAGKKYLVKLASPNAMVQLGMTRNTLKAGDPIVVQVLYPVPAIEKNGVEGVQGMKVIDADLKPVFDRALIK